MQSSDNVKNFFDDEEMALVGRKVVYPDELRDTLEPTNTQREPARRSVLFKRWTGRGNREGLQTCTKCVRILQV